MPALHAVIFDLDGTLVDSAPDIRNAVNLTLAAHARAPVTLDQVKIFVGDGLLATMERAFAATGAPLPNNQSYPRFQEFIEHYRAQKADPAQIYPGVVALLGRLRAAHIKIGLCTNKQQASTLRLLEELSLSDAFDFVAGGDKFMVHKPHAGHVTGVLEALGVKPANSLMIGDSRNDALAARGAGVACLIVTHGYGVDVDALKVEGLIDGFDKFDGALQRLGFVIS